MQPRWGRRGAGGRRRAGRAQPPLMFIQVSSEVFTIWRIRTSNIASSKIFSLPSPVITPSCSHSHSLTSRCDCDSRARGRMAVAVAGGGESCDLRARWIPDTRSRAGLHHIRRDFNPEFVAHSSKYVRIPGENHLDSGVWTHSCSAFCPRSCPLSSLNPRNSRPFWLIFGGFGAVFSTAAAAKRLDM